MICSKNNKEDSIYLKILDRLIEESIIIDSNEIDKITMACLIAGLKCDALIKIKNK
jgi:hypothetical protein